MALVNLILAFVLSLVTGTYAPAIEPTTPAAEPVVIATMLEVEAPVPAPVPIVVAEAPTAPPVAPVIEEPISAPVSDAEPWRALLRPEYRPYVYSIVIYPDGELVPNIDPAFLEGKTDAEKAEINWGAFWDLNPALLEQVNNQH